MTTATETHETTKDSLRINIDGSWTASEFSRLFRSLDALYIFFAARTPLRSIYSSPSQDLAFLRSALTEDGADKHAVALIEQLLGDRGDSAVRRAVAHLRDATTSDELKARSALEGAIVYLYKIRELARTSQVATISTENVPYLILEQSYKRFNAFDIDLLQPILIGGQEPLRVSRISFGSPGFTDIAGIGQIIGHIKDAVLEVLRRRDSAARASAEARKLSAEADLLHAQAEEVRAKAAELRSNAVERRISQLQSLGVEPWEVAKMATEAYAQLDVVRQFADSGRIISVKERNQDEA